MAAKTEPKLGFELHCPHCNESGSIKIDLNDLHGDLECGECSQEIRVLAAIELFEGRLQAWRLVRKFLDTAIVAIETADSHDTAF